MSILGEVFKGLRDLTTDVISKTVFHNLRKDIANNGIAVIPPFHIFDKDTGETMFAMELSERYYMFIVGKRTYCFIRETGEYDGWFEEGSAFSQAEVIKPKFKVIDGGKNKEKADVKNKDE